MTPDQQPDLEILRPIFTNIEHMQQLWTSISFTQSMESCQLGHATDHPLMQSQTGYSGKIIG